MELIRAGMSQGVAYRWANDEIGRADFDALALLCDFFTRKLGRTVDIGDILSTDRAQPESEASRDVERVMKLGGTRPNWPD